MVGTEPDSRAKRYFFHWTDERFTKDQAVYRMLLAVTRGIIRGDVIDLGCGSRVYYDTSLVADWVGIDLSPHLLDRVEFLGEGRPRGMIKTVQGDCRNLDLPDASFDYACAVFLLHHLARDNRATSRKIIIQAMIEAHRVLRPGGTLMVVESWPHVLLHFYGILFPVLYAAARAALGIELPLFFTARQFSRMAETAGFKSRYVLSSPVYDTVRYPVGGFISPPWFQMLTHKYGLYLFIK